ncbi:hypothetical protein PCE1_000664 [Barthelona sp. PCE]
MPRFSSFVCEDETVAVPNSQGDVFSMLDMRDKRHISIFSRLNGHLAFDGNFLNLRACTNSDNMYAEIIPEEYVRIYSFCESEKVFTLLREENHDFRGNYIYAYQSTHLICFSRRRMICLDFSTLQKTIYENVLFREAYKAGSYYMHVVKSDQHCVVMLDDDSQFRFVPVEYPESLKERINDGKLLTVFPQYGEKKQRDVAFCDGGLYYFSEIGSHVSLIEFDNIELKIRSRSIRACFNKADRWYFLSGEYIVSNHEGKLVHDASCLRSYRLWRFGDDVYTQRVKCTSVVDKVTMSLEPSPMLWALGHNATVSLSDNNLVIKGRDRVVYLDWCRRRVFFFGTSPLATSTSLIHYSEGSFTQLFENCILTCDGTTGIGVHSIELPEKIKIFRRVRANTNGTLLDLRKCSYVTGLADPWNQVSYDSVLLGKVGWLFFFGFILGFKFDRGDIKAMVRIDVGIKAIYFPYINPYDPTVGICAVCNDSNPIFVVLKINFKTKSIHSCNFDTSYTVGGSIPLFIDERRILCNGRLISFNFSDAEITFETRDVAIPFPLEDNPNYHFITYDGVIYRISAILDGFCAVGHQLSMVDGEIDVQEVSWNILDLLRSGSVYKYCDFKQLRLSR